MKITEIRLAEISQLAHREYVCEFGGKWNPRALILEFTGKYGVGSAGNDDADFIAMIRAGALAVINAKAVVYDFRGLNYEWGNSIWNALPCRRADSDAEEYLPTAMVISEQCRAGFSTCARMVPPMFETLEEALCFVEVPVRKYVDELMEDVD